MSWLSLTAFPAASKYSTLSRYISFSERPETASCESMLTTSPAPSNSSSTLENVAPVAGFTWTVYLAAWGNFFRTASLSMLKMALCPVVRPTVRPITGLSPFSCALTFSMYWMDCCRSSRPCLVSQWYDIWTRMRTWAARFLPQWCSSFANTRFQAALSFCATTARSVLCPVRGRAASAQWASILKCTESTSVYRQCSRALLRLFPCDDRIPRGSNATSACSIEIHDGMCNDLVVWYAS